MTPKILHVAGMKTESNFSDVHLDSLENMFYRLHSEEIMQNLK
jgi:hypothetical protein